MIKKATNTRVLKKKKSLLRLNQVQKELILGTIIGDGCLITSRSGKAARLQIRHNIKHKAYVEWKYSMLQNWVLTPPREDTHNNSWYFRTFSHLELMQIKRKFYNDGKRVIPLQIAEVFTSPLSLAVWLMDDGNGYPHYKGFRISTYGFGLEGNLRLKACLKANFSLDPTVFSDSKGYQLLIRKKDANELASLVSPYVVDCMKYKFITLTP